MDYELINTEIGGEIYRNGEPICRFPAGTRVIMDRDGELAGLVCVTSRPVDGVLRFRGQSHAVRVSPNEQIAFSGGTSHLTASPGLVLPN